MKKLIKIILIVGFLLVFIYAANGLITVGMDYFQNNKVIDEVQKKFYDTASAEKNASGQANADEHFIRPQFQDLLKENDDLVGWIKIEDTVIDYPILQSHNNEYYLTKNFNKEYSILGSIFMDFRNNIDANSQHTIIYGHRTKNGSMFEELSKFQNKDFFEEHPSIEFDTLYGSYEAEVFAVYITTTDFNYIQTDFSNDVDYEQFLTKIKENSIYQTDVEVNTDDQILTLSTCDYELDQTNGRLVIQAKLVKKG